MPHITFDDLKLHKAVLEIRHPQTYLFWDNCGKCILDINTKTKGVFDFKELRASHECALEAKTFPFVEFSFGVERSILNAQFLSNVEFFKDYSDILFGIVKDNLKISRISRVGFRLWLVYKTTSEKESQAIISDFGLFSVNAARFDGFGREITTSDPKLLIKGESAEEKVRMSFTAAHRDGDLPLQSKHLEEFSPNQCVLIDLDFSIENPLLEINLEKSIGDWYSKIKKYITNIINKPRE